jgi:hypothetical protein
VTDEEREVSIAAQELLKSAACQKTLSAMVSSYRKALEESEHDQKDLREHLYQLIQATKDFHRHLTVLANKGKLESVRRTARGGASSAV